MKLSSYRAWHAWLALSLLVALAGCVSDAEVRRLSLAEQSEFYVYRKVMTSGQERAYMAQPNAAARSAYLRQIGLVQRLEALVPDDRESVLGGGIRQGMSAEALRFVWGASYYTDGDARRSAHWHYLGSSFARGNTGNAVTGFGNRVDVYLVANKVVGWVDVAPSGSEDNGNGVRR